MCCDDTPTPAPGLVRSLERKAPGIRITVLIEVDPGSVRPEADKDGVEKIAQRGGSLFSMDLKDFGFLAPDGGCGGCGGA